MTDSSFSPDRSGLLSALDALLETAAGSSGLEFAASLPEQGIGETRTLELLAPEIIGGARRLGADTSFAHMDPPTPWVTWATALWNAALNQNLLHPELAPAARRIEDQVIAWLAPCFGMTGGHMTPGSTIANLTALWAAREVTRIDRVVASRAAHLSVAKSAHLLGLDFLEIETNACGQIDSDLLPSDLSKSALVLTAGTTSAGAIDDLGLANRAAWTHIDAAWAGPLRLSEKHRSKLDGLDAADSVAISAHKWLFQPKEAGLILFRDASRAHAAISFGGAYLAANNVGVLGSRGANAVPLLATLMSWGRQGVARRIDTSMDSAERLAASLREQRGVRLYSPNVSGVILWRSDMVDVQAILEKLPTGSASFTIAGAHGWVRHVAANPNVDVQKLADSITRALRDAAKAERR